MSIARSLTLGVAFLTLGVSQHRVGKPWLRAASRGLVRSIFRLRSRELLSGPDTTTLVFAPHQDDEVLGCGGLIAARRRQGLSVHVAFLTDGSASHAQHPVLTAETLPAVRRAEARVALKRLGVETPAIHFLDLRDGQLDKLDANTAEECVSRLAALLKRVNPTEIFLPYRHDGSSEHDAAFVLIARALGPHRGDRRIFEYPVWSWWSPGYLLRALFRTRRVVRFSFPGYAFTKIHALAAYRSQVEAVPPSTRPLLSPEFCRAFAAPEEFYFEN